MSVRILEMSDILGAGAVNMPARGLEAPDVGAAQITFTGAGPSWARVPGLDRLLLLLARIALSRGWLRAALPIAKAAVLANPTSLQANLTAGAAIRRAGHDIEVFQYFQQASRADDSRARGHWELAKVLLRQEREDAAPEDGIPVRGALLSALRTAARSSNRAIAVEASIALSDRLREIGDYAESAIFARRAADLAPSHPRALRALIDSSIPLNELGEARAACERLRSTNPRHSDLARRSLIVDQLGEARTPLVNGGEHVEILVVAGGGIGDILHVTPAIRNIAVRTGRRVDVLLAADSPGADFLVRNRQYVNAVWPGDDVFQRHYRTVFVTHSAGPMRFAIAADRVCSAHEWRRFRPGLLNETLFNLEAAKQLLGVPYEQEDAARHFVGDLAHRFPQQQLLVGIHTGSKPGRWLSKRWPYFGELIPRLIGAGVPVACFGLPDEYIEGAENRTGGDIEQMCRAMLDCSHFLSNDSGPMHIASALGIPTCALFAPTDPFTHLPLAGSTMALEIAKQCSPCEVKDHPYFASGACRCIGEITVSEVERAVLDLISSHRALGRSESLSARAANP